MGDRKEEWVGFRTLTEMSEEKAGEREERLEERGGGDGERQRLLLFRPGEARNVVSRCKNIITAIRTSMFCSS